MPSYKVFKPTEKIEKISIDSRLDQAKFMPTFDEWVRSLGERVLQGGSVQVANDYGVYTVATGYSFFLDSVYLDTNLAAGTQAIIYTTKGTKKILASDGVKFAGLSFPKSIKVEETEQLVLSTLGNGLVQYGIQGFLIKNVNIPVFWIKT